MFQLGARLWRDDGGALLALEWVFLATLLVFGLTTGLVAVRNAITSELTSVADAATQLPVCFSFSGLSNCAATTCGASVTTIPAAVPFLNSVNTPAFGTTNVTPAPCAEAGPGVGLPAAGTIGLGSGLPAAGNVPPPLPTGRSTGVPISTGTRDICPDVEPGGRVQPAATRPEDCVDRETGRPAALDTTVTPAATRGQRK